MPRTSYALKTFGSSTARILTRSLATTIRDMERKLATVLFVDLVASTEALADADPEVIRRRVSRFFDQVAHCIVTHGGTVEKFAGDAVMAALGDPVRGLSAPLVGRETELELLENTFERTSRARRSSLVTIYGDPGVGKSRLAREFLDGLEGATVLIGRCLPYGEGVTYWPLAEMVKASSGIVDNDPLDEAQEKLRPCCEDEAVADLLGLAVGVLEAVEGERSQQDIAWAARAWAEQLALAQPLVLVFEDVHWGEEPLLELLEHLASSVREAPLLIVCLARP